MNNYEKHAMLEFRAAGWSDEHGKFKDEMQEPVDSAEKAAAYLDARLWEFIDMAAAWPEAKPDPRIWGHVMVYAPKQPSKPWVGLTDEEIQDLGYLSEKFDASNSEWFDRWGFARAIESKLKEKNDVLR